MLLLRSKVMNDCDTLSHGDKLMCKYGMTISKDKKAVAQKQNHVKIPINLSKDKCRIGIMTLFSVPWPGNEMSLWLIR